MTRLTKEKLWKELDASRESFIRQHLATGGYDDARRPLVLEWLALRDSVRARRDSLWVRGGVD